MKLFDTHAHLDSPQLAENLHQHLADAQQDGLVGVVAIGTTVESSQTCLEIADRFENVWAAVGIHPNKCAESTIQDWNEIKSLAKHPKAVALGETGLDRHWDHCPFDVQQTWFDRHIELSFELHKPLVVHMRDCEADILQAFDRFVRNDAFPDSIHGIMHSFAGSLETAQQCLKWGMSISFAGMVTFKKSNDLRAVAKQIPSDRLLIETDAPYLSPHPLRSVRPNEPKLVRHTANCLAEVRGCEVEEIAELTTANARRIFGLSDGDVRKP